MFPEAPTPCTPPGRPTLDLRASPQAPCDLTASSGLLIEPMARGAGAPAERIETGAHSTRGWPQPLGPVIGSPVLYDLDVAAAGTAMMEGVVWVLEVDNGTVGPNSRADWPKIRRDLHNTGCRPGADPATVTSAPAGRLAALRLSPNPWLGAGALNLMPQASGPGRLEILDVSGRRLLERTAIAGAGSLALTRADLSGHTAGGWYLPGALGATRRQRADGEADRAGCADTPAGRK